MYPVTDRIDKNSTLYCYGYKLFHLSPYELLITFVNESLATVLMVEKVLHVIPFHTSAHSNAIELSHAITFIQYYI